MFVHIFAFRWKLGVSEDQKDRAIADIRQLQGAIPGLIDTAIGRNRSPRGDGFALGGVMRFRDEAAFEAYHDHGSHRALLSWLAPLIEAVEIDFPI